MKIQFYFCKHCGNVIAMIKDKGVPIKCCGENMQEIIPGTSNGAQEKHVPVVTVNGNTVKVDVGSVRHPMEEAHSIKWVSIVTNQGVQRKCLQSSTEPVVEFALCADEKLIETYAYCNLHGLWMIKA